MRKKLICLLLTVVLLSVGVSALAATPSKTTNDLNTVYRTINENDVPLGALISISSELSSASQNELNAITSFVAGNKPVAEYFSSDVQSSMAGFLPADVSASELILSELVSLKIGDYDASTGDVVTTLGFATQFEAGQPIVVLFGYTDASGNMVWQVLQGEVVNGMVKVTFPSDLLVKAGHNATLAILSK